MKKIRDKIRKAVAISSVVLLMVLVFTQSVSARSSTITGKPTALSSYDGYADVTLDTNGDGNGDWAMNLTMTQSQYDDIKLAKRDGKRVTIKYELQGGNYTVLSVQTLNNFSLVTLSDAQKGLVNLINAKKLGICNYTTIPR